MHFGDFLVSWGGGQKLWTRKIIYRKIFLRRNHMLTTAKVKQGRWVYEGGELEHIRKVLWAVTVCLGITVTACEDRYRVVYTITLLR
jgi:hypothetical protein